MKHFVILFLAFSALLAAGDDKSKYPVSQVNVHDFGAVGDGVADDTAAIQNAINTFSEKVNTGTVFFPIGAYKITSPLIYKGTYPSGIRISGEANTGGEGVGTVIQYRGPKNARACVLEFAGGADSIIERITLDVGPGPNRAQYALYIHNDPTRQSAGVNHLSVEHVIFSGRGTESNTACVSIGVGFDQTVDNTDCNDIQFVSCKFVGGEKGCVTGSGNVKNAFWTRCSFWFAKYGIDCGLGGSGAGIWSVRDCNFLWNTVSDMRIGAGQLTIDASQSEGSGMFVTNYGNTGNPANLNIVNSSWVGKSIGTDAIIKYQGAICVKGNQFINWRTPTSVPAIQLDWGKGQPSIIDSSLNYYENSETDYTNGKEKSPLFRDGHGWNALESQSARSSIRSFGDCGGVPGIMKPLPKK